MDGEVLFHGYPDASLVVDGAGLVVLGNAAAGRLFGCESEELTGQSLAALIPEGTRRATVEAFQRFMASEVELPSLSGPVRVEGRRLDGEIVELDLTVSIAAAPGDGKRLATVALRPVAEPRHVDPALEVSRYLDVAVRLSDGMQSLTDGGDAFAAILPALCTELEWDVANLWLVDAGQAYLTCAATWPGDGGWTAPFENASRALRLGPGEGLPGSSWGSGRPLVTSLGSGEATLLRQEAMQACGLRTGLAFPLVADSGTVGVVEMFTRRADLISPRLLDGVASIGRMIGQRLDQVDRETDLREGGRLSSFMLEAATTLAASENYDDALHRLAEIVVPEIADLCLIDVKERNGAVTRMAAVHADPAKAALVAELGERYPPTATGQHPSIDVMMTGRSRWATQMNDAFLRATTQDDRHLEIVKALGFESYMCVPLRAGDEVLGSITLVSAGSGRRFRSSDLARPEELADRVGGMVVSARRRGVEHQVARELQRLLLPERLPKFDGFDMCVRYIAGAPEAAAGGDFYDVVRLPSERIGLLVGDVEGHDTTAAAIMGQLRSASRALAGQVREPGQLVDALRWSWDLLGFERIATAVFARINPADGEVFIASAGHFPPVWLRRDGRAEFVDMFVSPPFGLAGPPVPNARFVLETDELLFFFTDGLLEERDVEIDIRLNALLGVIAAEGAKELDDLCDRVLRSFGRDVNPADDVAVLAIRRR